MSDTLEKLQRELEVTQRALVEDEARYARQDAKYKAIVKELEDRCKTLEHAHKEWETALDVVEDPIFLHDKDFHVLRCNRAYQQCAEIPFEQIIGQPYYNVFPKNQEPMHRCRRAIENAAAGVCVDEEVSVGDKIYNSRDFSITDGQGDYLYSVHILEDITAHKHAEKMLIASNDLLRTVVENTPIRVFWKDTELRYLGCNTAFARDAGMSRPQDLLGKDDFQMGWREQAELYRADDKRVMDSGTPKLGYEEPQATPDGRTIWLRTSKVPLRAADGKVFGMLGIYEDITESKKAEAELRRLNLVLKTLVEADQVLLHASAESELAQNICNVIIANRGYALALIGLVRHDENKRIDVVAIAGDGKGYVDSLQLSWDDRLSGQGPGGIAVRTGQTQIVHDIRNDPHYEPWREMAVKYHFASSIALPLKENGETFGILGIYANEASAFGASEVALLEEVANDLAFGIVNLRTRVERDHAVQGRQHYMERLRASLEEALQAIALTVEMRDPYTAGHQRGVANLAKALAKELGINDEEVHGIYLAAIVHDIGKISVPAEILVKPGRLNDLEYAMVKQHVSASYEILKGINFPWPIADMVHQHHERLDGKGYPLGLKNGDILFGSRIIAVADVVEAMSSHRPYRPALGIELALNEIEKGRSTLYDPAVVEACLKLFREGRFEFEKR